MDNEFNKYGSQGSETGSPDSMPRTTEDGISYRHVAAPSAGSTGSTVSGQNPSAQDAPTAPLNTGDAYTGTGNGDTFTANAGSTGFSTGASYSTNPGTGAAYDSDHGAAYGTNPGTGASSAGNYGAGTQYTAGTGTDADTSYTANPDNANAHTGTDAGGSYAAETGSAGFGTGTAYTPNSGAGTQYTAGTGADAGADNGYTGMKFDDGFGQFNQDAGTHAHDFGNTGTYYSKSDQDGSGYSSTDYSDSSSGSSYGGGSGGDGGVFDYNNTGYDPYGNGPRAAAKSKPLYITRRSLILLLILCMILTSALTFGGIVLYNKSVYGGGNSATSYKLTKSNETLSYKSIIQKTQDSVVSITTSSVSTDGWAQNYVTEGAGSGIVIQSNGYIMTCNHVIDGASKIKVTLRNKKTYTAKVVGADSDNDIAVLKINAVGLSAATYGDSSDLSVGDRVVAIGNPLGELSNTATTGIISALNRNLTIDGETMNLLQTDASINPGNSGGALFNASGNLIGVVVAKSTGSDVEGLGFAIPINRAAKVAKNLIKTGKGANGTSSSSTPKIGVTVSELTAEEAAQSGLDGAGLYVADVTSSNAKAAGFKVGDRIISADGTVASSYDKLQAVLKKHKSGDKIKVIVARDGKSVTLTTTLS